MPKTYRDTADWGGVDFKSVDVGADSKPGGLIFDDYHYATKGEWRLAKLLTSHGIPFTPDVGFALTMLDGRLGRFVPDFVFNAQSFIWTAEGKQRLIHGIEVKGHTRAGTFSERALEKVRLLREQRGIIILLLSDAQVKHYFCKNRLPLRPLDSPP
jgi:hypothetical protein